MKILLADDSSAMRALLARYLAEIGLTDMDHAANGEEALAMTLRTPYGLILLDCNMPKKSGIDVLTVVRARGNKVPVIMVTTETEKTRVLEAIKAGVNDYLFKPFVKETLIAKVQKILGPRP
jgi:two-component system chemotaxis response regulator CheY